MVLKDPKEKISDLLEQCKDDTQTLAQTLDHPGSCVLSNPSFFKTKDTNKEEICAKAKETTETIRGISKELGISHAATNSTSLGLGTSSSGNINE